MEIASRGSIDQSILCSKARTRRTTFTFPTRIQKGGAAVGARIALHCIALHRIALHCIASHCIALHCIALHCVCLLSLDSRKGAAVLVHTRETSPKILALRSDASRCLALPRAALPFSFVARNGSIDHRSVRPIRPHTNEHSRNAGGPAGVSPQPQIGRFFGFLHVKWTIRPEDGPYGSHSGLFPRPTSRDRPSDLGASNGHSINLMGATQAGTNTVP
jgi:hypothetical protein